MESLLSWVLTFGDMMEIVKPVEIREKLYHIADRIKNIYQET